MKKLIPIILCFFCLTPAFTQNSCSDGQVEIILNVRTDRFPENSWVLATADSVYTKVNRDEYERNAVFADTFCVSSTTCMTFTIYDGFGDGITQGGGFEILINRDTILAENEFGLSRTYEVNCLPGTSCNQAISVKEGEHLAPRRESWYQFTPDTVGTFTISTCQTNTCDTRIWVYDRCESYTPDNEEGFIFYDDNGGGCGQQAVVNAFFAAGKTYLIRITDRNKNCADSIAWSLEFRGPVIGCMNPNSCNYNPLATIDDGSCRPQGDPLCPKGPDFAIDQEVLLRSLFVDTIFNDDECLINEKCVTGFGKREVIRFATRFKNIGELDYYIGEPTLENTQFEYDECHRHFHYENYAEYLLYEGDGTPIPSGYKSGFCVIDLKCEEGNNKYGCANMGLTAGCYDEYAADLDCQWIDVTDIPDGDITFVARVNWNNLPDALGRVERDLTNNWAQVCMTLDRSSGQLEMTIKEDCPILADCEGQLYGNAQLDCEGVCGGAAKAGDYDKNQSQDMQDVQGFLNAILEKEVATPCNDLNADDRLTVYDAALLADCIYFGNAHPHNTQGFEDHCDFPIGVFNNTDTVEFRIGNIDETAGFVDLELKNEYSSVVAFQLNLKGVDIRKVENLMDITAFPAMVQANIGSGIIAGLATDTLSIPRSRAFRPFLRIYYHQIVDDFICLDEITEVVNADYHQVVGKIGGDCVAMTTSTRQVVSNVARVIPNPFNNQATIFFPNSSHSSFTLLVTNLNGQIIHQQNDIRGTSLQILADDWASGVYHFQLTGNQQIFVGKLMIVE